MSCSKLQLQHECWIITCAEGGPWACCACHGVSACFVPCSCSLQGALLVWRSSWTGSFTRNRPRPKQTHGSVVGDLQHGAEISVTRCAAIYCIYIMAHQTCNNRLACTLSSSMAPALPLSDKGTRQSTLKLLACAAQRGTASDVLLYRCPITHMSLSNDAKFVIGDYIDLSGVGVCVCVLKPSLDGTRPNGM